MPLFRCSAFVLLVLCRAFPLPLPTGQMRLHHTAPHSLACILFCPLGWHPTAPHDSWHLQCGVALLARWLPSPSSSAPAIYSTVADLEIGYAVSWYSTTSLAHAKVRNVADFPGCPPGTRPSPKPIGSGSSLRHPATVVLSFLSVGTGCRKILFFCFGGPAEWFVSFPWFFSILVCPYVSGGRYSSILLSS